MNRLGLTSGLLYDPSVTTDRQNRVLHRLLEFYGPCPLVGKIFRRYLRHCEREKHRLAQLVERPKLMALHGQDRGKRSEHKVASVLEYLAENDIIDAYEHTAPAYPGADFLVHLQNGSMVMLEVKSSPGAIRKHFKTYFSKGLGGHPVNGRKSRKKVFRQVLRVLSR